MSYTRLLYHIVFRTKSFKKSGETQTWNKTFNKLIPELSVINYNNSLNFYVNILGFKIDYIREKNHFAMLSINGVQIMIEEYNGNWDTGKLDYPDGYLLRFTENIEIKKSPMTQHYK
ncbi:MAG: hypothetical protein LBT51_00500 [Fusobacteriaceae bacterium]|jgi:hypothetical protein|nr:hypothetical protein [Fusobacteriaceae bacterium]